jgi:hypothetical protein
VAGWRRATRSAPLRRARLMILFQIIVNVGMVLIPIHFRS